MKVGFRESPGQMFEAAIAQVIHGIGEEQVAVSKNLADINQFGTTLEYLVRISIPQNIQPETLRLGMGIAGTATVYSESASPIGFLATMLLWMRAYAFYF